MKYAKSKNLSRYDVLIIASMIEREAQLAKERPLVSAVIYNRLKEGMPLGIDATIRYATNNWTRPIKQSELDKHEPYNTRLNRGLPPTPIGNPGLASLKAAAKPANKSYLYYVRKPTTSPASTRSPRPTRSSSRTSQRYQGVAQGDSDAPRACAAGRSPTRARRRCTTRRSRSSGWTTGATSGCRSRRTCSPRPSRRCRSRLPRRQRHDPAQGGGARARRRARPRPRGRSAPPTRSRSSRRPDPRRQHRRDRLPERARTRSAYEQTALVLGAGGSARAVVYALQQAGRQRAPRLEPHRRSARKRSPTSSAPTSAPSRPTSSSTARRSACTTRPTTFKALPLQADDLGAGCTVVDMVYRNGGTLLLNTAKANGARGGRRAGDPGRPGRSLTRALDRPDGSRPGDAGGRRRHRPMSSTFDTPTQAPTRQRHHHAHPARRFRPRAHGRHRRPRLRRPRHDGPRDRARHRARLRRPSGSWSPTARSPTSSSAAPSPSASASTTSTSRSTASIPTPRSSSRPPPSAATRPCPSPSSATARCSSRWSTPPTCSRSTTSR